MRWVHWARRHPSAVLFAVQIVGILLYPAMGDQGVGRSMFNAFGLLVVLLALWSVRTSPGLTWVGALLAAPAALLLLIGAFVDSAALGAWSSGLESALYVYSAGCMLAYMLADATVTTDEIWAVGATFTLLAWAFAHCFAVIQFVQPGSFAGTSGDHRTWGELLFLSISNMSNTGLSDIVPVKPMARSLVAVGQIVGVGYIAMLVSRVVALAVTANRKGDS